MPRRERDRRGELSPMERAAAEWLVILDNGPEAMRRAGYAEASAAGASKFFKRPVISDAVAALRRVVDARAAAKVDATLDAAADFIANRVSAERRVIDVLLRNVARAEQKGDIAGVNGAAKLLGEAIGLWKTRVEHSGPNGGPVQVQEVVVTRRIVRPGTTDAERMPELPS
jgi:hypothetical protein